MQLHPIAIRPARHNIRSRFFAFSVVFLIHGNHPDWAVLTIFFNTVVLLALAGRCHIKNLNEKVFGDQNEINQSEYQKKRKIMRLEPGFPVLGQAVPAVDRPSFSWFEGDFALFATV
jgi:hypothetical protein